MAEVVAVVLVEADDSRLAETLAAIEAQTRRPDRVIQISRNGRGWGAAVDAALAGEASAQSGAASADLEPVGVESFGFESAMEAQTPSIPAARKANDYDEVAPEKGQWLWLLSSDSAPDREALAHLLAAVETGPSIAVAGCKTVEWHDAQRLRDVGLSTTRFGGLFTGLDRGELDQGQHDKRSDVMVVRLAGMMVRRDVWETLGGPDSALTGARADLDFCRRVHLAGHRVVVVPQAVMSSAVQTSFRDDRRDALLLRMVWTPWFLIPFALIWSVIAAVGRSVAHIVLEQPQRSLDELIAVSEILIRPDRWILARHRIRDGAETPLSVLRPLQASPRDLLRQRRDELTAWIRPAGRGAAARVQREGLARRLTPLLSLALITAVASAAAAHWIPGAGQVTGTYLPPVPDDAGRLWSLATDNWRPVGLGLPATGDPVSALTAAASWLVGGVPARFVAIVLLSAPLLAGVIAYLCTATLTGSGRIRFAVALAWSAAPPLLAAAISGRVGAVLVHLLLPMLALAWWRSLAMGSVSAAAMAGLLMAGVVAASPGLTLLLAAVLVLLSLVTIFTRGVRRVLMPVLMLIAPVMALLPWWEAVLRHPLLLVADPAAGWNTTVVAPWWHLAGLAEAPITVFGPPARLVAAVPALADPQWQAIFAGAIAISVTAPVVISALFALFRRRGGFIAAVACWLVALLALTASLQERVAVGGGRWWSGPAMSVMLIALFGAGLVVAPVFGRRVGRGTSRGRRLIAGLVTVAAVLGPMAAIAMFGAGAGQRELTRAPADLLPVVTAQEARSPAGSRTLVLMVGQQNVRWDLLRDGGTRWGADSAMARILQQKGALSSDAEVIDPLVGDLLSDVPVDRREELADLAIGSVLLRAPIDQAAEQALDSSPGLVRVSAGAVAGGTAGSPSGAAMWRVDPPASNSVTTRPWRVRVLAPDGATTAVIGSQGTSSTAQADVPEGESGRTLVLAERADPNWRAWMDGVELSAATSEWAQTWSLPAHAGVVRIAYAQTPAWLDSRWVRIAQILALIFVALIALPLPDVRARIARPEAPRDTRPVSRGSFARDPAPAPRVFDADHPEAGILRPLLPREFGEDAEQSLDEPESELAEPDPETLLTESEVAEPSVLGLDSAQETDDDSVQETDDDSARETDDDSAQETVEIATTPTVQASASEATSLREDA